MPELPEVETIRRGLHPLQGARLTAVEVRESRLRRRVSAAALQALVGRRVGELGRRAKYLLMPTIGGGGMLLHMGMSGSLLLLLPNGSSPARHDHVSWWFESRDGNFELRFRDPRRFGLVAARSHGALGAHRLLRRLGPEPLGDGFSAAYLYARTRGSRRPIKTALMDAELVAGIGNIYASEALWRAEVNPKRPAGRISSSRWQKVRDAVRVVLEEAIAAGGTTLSDFRGAAGDPGYFQVRLSVYDRAGTACDRCGATVRKIVQAGRATYYCPGCQH